MYQVQKLKFLTSRSTMSSLDCILSNHAEERIDMGINGGTNSPETVPANDGPKTDQNFED